jgi:4'-phosphopantetheinyl transferase
MQIEHLPFELSEPLQAGIWKIEESESWFASQLHIWPEELEQLARIQAPQKRLQWLASRLLVRRILMPKGKIVSEHLNDGRPVLRGSDKKVSYTHTGQWAMALICPQSFIPGVDIEHSHRVIPEIVQNRFLHPRELEIAEAAGSHAHILKILAWSAKETLFKCMGRNGISFKQDFYLHLPQEVIPDMKGILPATIYNHGNEKTVNVSYAFFRDLVCTWLVIPDDTFRM